VLVVGTQKTEKTCLISIEFAEKQTTTKKKICKTNLLYNNFVDQLRGA